MNNYDESNFHMSFFHNELHEFYEFLSSDRKNGGAGRQMKNEEWRMKSEPWNSSNSCNSLWTKDKWKVNNEELWIVNYELWIMNYELNLCASVPLYTK